MTVVAVLALLMFGVAIGVTVVNSRVYHLKSKLIEAEARREDRLALYRGEGAELREAAVALREAGLTALKSGTWLAKPAQPPGAAEALDEPGYVEGSVDDPKVWEALEGRMEAEEEERWRDIERARQRRIVAVCPHCKTVGHTDPDCPEVVR